ncbi:MAG: hypothetical protein O4807_21865 [Trichodesmium sp. St19_bin2]|nr:hypothetical protein [Trichodesmium sp. St19_bin2]
MGKIIADGSKGQIYLTTSSIIRPSSHPRRDGLGVRLRTQRSEMEMSLLLLNKRTLNS